MSDKRPFFHGWRASVHYLTRDRRFLLRTAAGIVALGMIIANAIVLTQSLGPQESHDSQITPAQNALHREYHELRLAITPQPRQLATWLRRMLAQLNDKALEAFAHAPASTKLGEWDIAELLHKHATTDAPVGLFQDFLTAALAGDGEAAARLEKNAQAKPPAMLASEFVGSIHKRHGQNAAALQAFFHEGLSFPDAAASREEALRLAVTQRNLDVLRLIAAQPGWVEACHPLLQNHAGALLGDVWMQWRGLIYHRFNVIPYGLIALAFFAATLWYFILVQHSDHERWRWIRPMAPLMAGVCSVWPTISLAQWQDFYQGMTSDAPFPHDLIYYLLGVGLREEGCKLVLFTLFLPWLLWRRAPGLALLTGAFIGLGFSLEENIDYYEDYGGMIAWTRFLSANFLHISLTGICAHSFYHMLRTRFAQAAEFIATFLAAVAAHGAYDWLGAAKLGDNGWLSIIVLVLSVSKFIDLLAEETRPFRRTIAPRAVFTFGSAVLIAVSFILGAWSTRSMEGVAEAGQECLSMVPIAILYWRKFENC